MMDIITYNLVPEKAVAMQAWEHSFRSLVLWSEPSNDQIFL